MFSFIPQLLIILSIVGIIVIVLRKTLPHQVDLVNSTDLRSGAVLLLGKIWQFLVKQSRKLWHFVLEVKGLSKNPRLWHLPKTFSKIHLPKGRLAFWGPVDSPEYFLAKGRESLDSEDYEDAERKFIKVIEKDPHNEQAFDELGKLYIIQKKFKEATETYKFLVKHYPENDGYFSKLGQAYHNQKAYDQAIRAYEQAIELAPSNARRYINLGLSLEAKNHLEEAILNYRRAVELESSNPQFLMALADALIKKEEKEESELILEKILQIEPTNHLAREKLMQLKF